MSFHVDVRILHDWHHVKHKLQHRKFTVLLSGTCLVIGEGLCWMLTIQLCMVTWQNQPSSRPVAFVMCCLLELWLIIVRCLWLLIQNLWLQLLCADPGFCAYSMKSGINTEFFNLCVIHNYLYPRQVQYCGDCGSILLLCFVYTCLCFSLMFCHPWL